MDPNLQLSWSGKATDTNEAAMKTMQETRMPLALLGLAIAACVVLPGCGAETGLVASHPTAPSPRDNSVDLSSFGASIVSEGIVGGADVTDWSLVAGGWVTPTAAAKVEGSRYSVKFPRGSVANREYVTIRERDPLVADVEFGPHGTGFLIPVEVTIDYRGTAYDPDSENYIGLVPTVCWYDPSAQAWQAIPSRADKKLKKVRFHLEHFSRYAMLGGAVDGEWQWTRTGG